MIAELQPYSKMKDSGIPWLGQVPEHWDVQRLKRFLVKNDSGVWGDEFNENGTIVLRSTEQTIDGKWRIVKPARIHLSEEQRTSAYLEHGDLVVTKSSGSQAHIGKTSKVTKDIAALPCCFSNFMQRLRPNQHLDSSYLWYFLNSSNGRTQLQNLSTSTTGLGNLNGTHLGNCYLSVPPLPEQAAIVKFLNYMDRRITKYIRAKERLITLLEEQKQALIHRAVTRGLDPNVKLKDSGVEWLGQIPEHWSISSVKQHFDILLGKMLQNKPLNVDDIKVPYLKAQNVQWQNIRTTNNQTMWASPYDLKRYKIQAGDLLVCEGGEGGRCGIISKVPQNCIIQNALHRVRAKFNNHNAYLLYLMIAIANQGWFDAINHKATIAHFTKEKFGSLQIPIPPSTEQVAIISYLNKQTTQIKSVKLAIRNEISLLQELRTRLISDVVTGKLDVQEAAARLPHETAETDHTEPFDDYRGELPRDHTRDQDFESPEEER